MTPIIDAYKTGYEASFENGEVSNKYYIPSFG
jgi:hypothetical protein